MVKDKKSTINPKNNDDKTFQYAITKTHKEYLKLNHL